MKIAIFSDSHDNTPNLNIFLNWVNKNDIFEIIFCGDLCVSRTLRDIILPSFSGTIHMVFGNVTDREGLAKVVKKFPQVIHYGDEGSFVADNKCIGFVHYPDRAKDMAATGEFDYVFYGHTHKPWEEKIGKCTVVNPGTLAGLFYKATFAVLDTSSSVLELKILETLDKN